MSSILYMPNREYIRLHGGSGGDANILDFGALDMCDELFVDEEELETFEIVQINDFTSEEIKAEAAEFEEKKSIPIIEVCPAKHGGPLDYPKTAPKCVVRVLEKWDICYDHLERVIRARKPTRPVKPSMIQGVPVKVKHEDEIKEDSDEEVFQQLAGAGRQKNGRNGVGKTAMHNELNCSIKQALTECEAFLTARSSSAQVLLQASFEEEDRVNEEEFHSAVSESTAKMLLQKLKIVKKALAGGDVGNTLKIISGLFLIRNKLWHYNEYLQVHEKPRAFKDLYLEVCELIDACSEQVLEYYMNLVATTVLHDAMSNDWDSDRPFYEGQKVSHSIQLWWYYMQGIKSDLWKSVSPKAAIKIFSAVFLDSLGIITSRYIKIKPTEGRLCQYRADITSVLLAATETLPSLVSSVESMFMVGGDLAGNLSGGMMEGNLVGIGGTIRDIHAKCCHLMTALTVVGAPIPDLTEALASDKKSRSYRKRTLLSEADKSVTWMHLIRPDMFPDKPDNLNPGAHLTLLSKICSSQPEPPYPLVVQTILCRELAVAKLIMLHFGAFVPNLSWEAADTSMTEGCKKYGCCGECIGVADVFWPQAVGTGVMQVCMSGVRSPYVLITLMDPLLKRLSKESWEAISKSNIWNPKKPVCFQGIVHLLAPYVWPVLQELLDLIGAGKAWTSGHVSTAMKEVIQAMQDVVPVIPTNLLLLLSHLDSVKPESVKPVGGSALIQMLISTLYSLISRLQPLLRKNRLAKEKLDFIAAFGEAICNMENTKDLLQIQVVADETLASDGAVKSKKHHTQERDYDRCSDSFSSALSEVAAGELLSTRAGAMAAKVLYRFICYNVEWIQSCMTSSSASTFPHPTSSSTSSFHHHSTQRPSSSPLTLEIPVLIQPWGSETHPPKNPHDSLNRIGLFCVDDGMFNVNQCANKNVVNLNTNNKPSVTSTHKNDNSNVVANVEETNFSASSSNNGNASSSSLGVGGVSNKKSAPKLRYESIMSMNHQWGLYLKNILVHGNPILVDKLIEQRPEFREGEEKTLEEETGAKHIMDLWKKRKEDWAIVN